MVIVLHSLALFICFFTQNKSRWIAKFIKMLWSSVKKYAGLHRSMCLALFFRLCWIFAGGILALVAGFFVRDYASSDCIFVAECTSALLQHREYQIVVSYCLKCGYEMGKSWRNTVWVSIGWTHSVACLGRFPVDISCSFCTGSAGEIHQHPLSLLLVNFEQNAFVLRNTEPNASDFFNVQHSHTNRNAHSYWNLSLLGFWQTTTSQDKRNRKERKEGRKLHAKINVTAACAVKSEK